MGVARGVGVFVALELVEIALELRAHAAGVGVQFVVHHFFGRSEDAAVFAKEMMEGLQLGVGLVHQPDDGIPLDAGHEVVDVDPIGRGPMRLTRPMRCMRRVAFHGVS